MATITKRVNSDGSVSWKARVYLRRTATGKRKFAIKSFDNRRAAERYATRWERRKEKGQPLVEPVTLFDCAREYVEWLEDNGRSTGYVLTMWDYLKRAVEYFGNPIISTIDSEDWEAWQDHLSTLPNGRGGTYSDATIKAHRHAVSGMYRRIAEPKGYVKLRRGLSPGAFSSARRECHTPVTATRPIMLEG